MDWSSDVGSSDLAGAGSGEYVEIRKIESKPATRVVFAPAQQNLRLQGSSQALKRVFVGRPLCQGDVVATAGQQRVDNIPPNVAQYLRAQIGRASWRERVCQYV